MCDAADASSARWESDMTTDQISQRSEFEKELRALRASLQEEREKAVRGSTIAQEGLKAVDRRLQSIEDTLRCYCEVHGIPFETGEADQDLRRRFKNMRALEAIVALAKEAGGIVIMTDVARTLLRAALYAHERSASGSLYGMLIRHPELFEKIGPGRFRLTQKIEN